MGNELDGGVRTEPALDAGSPSNPTRTPSTLLDDQGRPIPPKEAPKPDTSAHEAQIKDLQDRLTTTSEELFEAKQGAKAANLPEGIRGDPTKLLQHFGLDPWEMVSDMLGDDAAQELKGKADAPPPDPEKTAMLKRMEALEKDAERGKVLEAKQQLRGVLSNAETEVLGSLGDEGVDALYAELERYVEKYKELPEGEAWTRVLSNVDQAQKAQALHILGKFVKVPALKVEMKKLLGVKGKADTVDTSDPQGAEKAAEKSLNDALMGGFNPLRERDTGRHQPRQPNPSNMDSIVKNITTLAQARAARRK